MSAYVVEDKTINQIVNWLEYYRRQSDWLQRAIDKLKLGFTTADRDWQAQLAAQMASLNRLAVYQRYSEADDVEPLRYNPTDCASPIQVYKSLRCWLYQCSEGNVPENPLFRFFEHEVQITLAAEIITGRPEYSKANWD